MTAGPDLTRLRGPAGPGVTVLDARARGTLRRRRRCWRQPSSRGPGAPLPAYVVIDGLAVRPPVGRGQGGRVLQPGVPAALRPGRHRLLAGAAQGAGPAFIEQVTSVTQCVLEVGRRPPAGDQGRGPSGVGAGPAAADRRARRRSIRLEDERALGRLGQGLERVRRERNLSQSDLARLAGVTPSAISQAEAGRRGLSLETLLAALRAHSAWAWTTCWPLRRPAATCWPVVTAGLIGADDRASRRPQGRPAGLPRPAGTGRVGRAGPPPQGRRAGPGGLGARPADDRFGHAGDAGR